VLAIFVKPPSLEVLSQRLQARQTDSASSISSRLFKAKFELSFEDKFDAVIVNQNLEDAFREAETLVHNFLKDSPVPV
jgi:guanylate kinase